MNNTNSPKIIGSTTRVDFPELSLLGVPAKVDTGADSSAIWASNIVEKQGELSFELFRPESSFYTGKTITTKKYVIRLITNSFGQTEYRYKVPLKIKLEGKLVIARFTLSDRGQNKYPMLIGRRTLHGKFVVDVAKHGGPVLANRHKNVLILLTKGGDKFDTFYKHLNTENQDDFVTEIRRYSDLAYVIQDGVFHIKNTHNNKDLAIYDLLYFQTSVQSAEFASIIAAYARWSLVPHVDKATENLAPDTKLHQLALLSLFGIHVPDTTYWASGSYESVAKTLGLPFILKDNHGRKGRNNYLIKSSEEYLTALDYAKHNDIQLLAQKYIKNDGYYRVLVLGKQVSLVMFRSVDQKRSHLFEKAIDGPAKLLKPQDLPGEVIAMCIRAADKLGWQVAGVDVIQDKDSGKWYCLEVNNSPQLVSGAFVNEKRAALANFFKQQMDK